MASGYALYGSATMMVVSINNVSIHITGETNLVFANNTYLLKNCDGLVLLEFAFVVGAVAVAAAAFVTATASVAALLHPSTTLNIFPISLI